MNTLATIEQHCRHYADARTDLAAEVQSLNDKIEQLKRDALPKLKHLVARAAERKSVLKGHIESAPELFVRPRTVIFHGIKAGYQKGAGSIDWEDDAKVVALIEKHYSPARADLLIKTTKKPIAKALADLDVAELCKLGCTIEPTGDYVVIRPTDSAVDKIVDALLKGATAESETEAA